MPKNRKKVIVSSLLGTLFLLFGFTYFLTFGPIYVSFNLNKIEAIAFVASNDEQNVVYIDEEHQAAVVTDLQKNKIRRMPFRCKCRGMVNVEITYHNQSKVEFDGYYLVKTSANGNKKYFSTQAFATKINEIYQTYVTNGQLSILHFSFFAQIFAENVQKQFYNCINYKEHISIKQVVTKTILIKLVEGDEIAFNTVYEAYYRLIKHITFSYTKDNDLADDLVLETFVLLWKNRAKIDVENKNFMYYLTQIANNLCINYVKKEKLGKIDLVENYQLDEIASRMIEHPEVSYNRMDKMLQISTLIDEKSYDILILHYVHGLKYKEIALLKNVTTSAITVQASRALRTIKQRIKQ